MNPFGNAPLAGAIPPAVSVGALRGVRALVVGLGRFGGGVGVTRWLVGQGADVTVTDQAPAEALTDSLAAIADLPVNLQLGGHDPSHLRDCDLVVVNPAVDKRRSGFFADVVRSGLPWTTELNLFCERCPASVIGVTGTFGKSTTCAMLAAALEACRSIGSLRARRVHLGGNIGRSLLGELADMTSDDVVVLELSSAQLEDLPRIPWLPQVGVLTNIHPHHLDRHGTLADYARAKLNLLGPADGTSPVIVGPLHPEAESLLRAALGASIERLTRVDESRVPSQLRVPGRHNAANAACVATACAVLGLPDDHVAAGLRDFPGLPHRLEHVSEVGGVEFINDSKSTAPSATMVALEAIDRPIVLMLGGQRKDTPLEPLATAVARKCRAVVCMGDAGPAFASAIRKVDGSVNVLETDRMPAALAIARQVARPGEVVLLSPGAPSFDHYVNYEARGKEFAALVRSLG